MLAYIELVSLRSPRLRYLNFLVQKAEMLEMNETRLGSQNIFVVGVVRDANLKVQTLLLYGDLTFVKSS